MDEAANALSTIKMQSGNENSRANTPRKYCISEKVLDKNKRKNFICHYCGKKGHFARNCFKKRDQLKNYKESEKAKRNTYDNPANIDPFLTLESNCLSQVLDLETEDVWILDSGASKHMSFRREWFVELDESYKETVSLGDNSTCEVKGRGIIFIKRLVDNRWLDGKLEDVLYILSLRRNLFSTGVCTTKKLHFKGRSQRRKNISKQSTHGSRYKTRKQFI